MIQSGVVLALAAAMAWGAGDMAGGVATRRTNWLAASAAAQLVGFALLLGALLILRPSAPTPATVALGAVGGIFGGLALAALYRALATGAMGLVSAISGAGGALIPVAVGALLFQQAVTSLQLAGIVAVLVAIAAASGATVTGVSRRGLLLALTAAVGFGLWFLFLGRAAEGGQLWALVSARGAAAVALGGTALLRHAVSDLRRVRGLVLLAGVMDVTANGLVVTAFASVSVGIAAALSNMYPLSTMLLARVLLGERLPRLGMVAVGLAVAGIVLISLGG